MKKIESKIDQFEQIYSERNIDSKKSIDTVAGSLLSINRFIKECRTELDIYKNILKSNRDKDTYDIIIGIKKQLNDQDLKLDEFLNIAKNNE